MDEGPLGAALLSKTELCGKRPFRATPRELRPSRHGDLRHRLMAATLLSAIKHFEPRLGRNGDQTLPRSHRASSRLEKARSQLCSATSSVCRSDGHGGDRAPCQLDTVRAPDYDRLLRLPSTRHKRVSTPDSGTGASQNFGLRLPLDDLVRSIDRSPAAAP